MPVHGSRLKNRSDEVNILGGIVATKSPISIHVQYLWVDLG